MNQKEYLFALFIIENNSPITPTNLQNNILKQFFWIQKLLKKWTCTKTKTAIIVNCRKNIGCLTRKTIFICNNDVNNKKLYPLFMTYSNEKKDESATALLILIKS